MPAPTSVDDLIDMLRKSKLLEPARLDGYLTTHPGPHDSAEALCDRLRADGLITPFHAEQLLKGKYRGFFLGKYKLLDRIGLGGMGQVFLAEHTSMKRRSALKVLPPERAENEFARERFMREARAAGQLDHPNLVRAFDVEAVGDLVFLVLEYVDGISLHDLIARHGRLAPERVGYYIWQAANGLAYMNGNGLVHRDIKPANLILDRLGVVKILDLGLVRSDTEQDELTRQEGVTILGTADYLAPEQAINSSHVDVRADIYSLGATAYFMLTGQPPFTQTKIAQKLIAHQVQAVKPVREHCPGVPAELAAAVEKMLAKKPADRFQSPAEVMAALDAFALNPPAAPSEREIPATVGGMSAGPGSVNLSNHLVRASRLGGGSSHSMGGISGSAIRYHAADGGGRPPSMSDTAVPPAHITPLPPAKMPPPPTIIVPAPEKLTAPTPAAAKGLPPILPAAATHVLPEHISTGKTAMPIKVSDLFKRASPPPPDLPAKLVTLADPTPEHSTLTRQRLSMALAFALTLAVAAWDVALLTGATRRTESQPKEQTVEKASPKK